MAGVNKVILIGNLGKDPDVMTFENGVKKVSFPLATTETYKNRDGQRVEQTEWHNIVMWRGLAEVAEKYLRKGNSVYIEGRIRTRSYEVEGVKRYITEIMTDNMTMLGRKDQSSEQPRETPPPTDTSQNPEASKDSGPTDDLPF